MISRGVCKPSRDWNASGGLEELISGLNFAGHNLKRQPLRVPTAKACYDICETQAGCEAFTFIIAKRSIWSRCWLKHAGYERGAFRSENVVSGILPLDAALKNRISQRG